MTVNGPSVQADAKCRSTYTDMHSCTQRHSWADGFVNKRARTLRSSYIDVFPWSRTQETGSVGCGPRGPWRWSSPTPGVKRGYFGQCSTIECHRRFIRTSPYPELDGVPPADKRAMAPWIFLLLLSHVAAVPPPRIPEQEMKPPLRWNSKKNDVGVVPIGVQEFQRDAVESPPMIVEYLTDVADYKDFGSHRYPLRDAVEALPTSMLGTTILQVPSENIQQLSKKVPLRDAVEHREAPFFGSIDHESIWIEPLVPPTLRRAQNLADPKVVCYLDSKSACRSEPFSLPPQLLPNFKCTHFVYAAATIDPQELVVISRDPEYDIVKGGYKAVTGLRRRDPKLRVLISIAPGNGGHLFREATRACCTSHCEKLIVSILRFLEHHEFDGVEIDSENSVEYPEDFKAFLKRLGVALRQNGYILALTQRPEDPADREIASITDLILLRAWRDVPGYRREKLALHPAPLKFVIRVTNKWITRLSSEQITKIVLGLPSFGQGYTLKFGNFTDAGAPVLGPGIQGPYTKRQDGRLAYYEVCEKLEEGLWTSGRDEEGPYLKRGDQWIGYEDPISVKIKAAYVRSAGLGGISFWSLDSDDFQGICGNPWPMLNAVTQSLGYYDETTSRKCITEGLFSDPENCSGFYSCFKGTLHHRHCDDGNFFNSLAGRCTKAIPDLCKPEHVDRFASHQFELPANLQETGQSQDLQALPQSGPRVVCYITSWALYRKGEGKFVPENLDPHLCTDVVYAFAGLNPETLIIQTFDPWADIENNLYQRLTSIRGPRMLLGLGGWTDSAGDKYSRLISSGASRRKFVAAAVNFLNKYNFDGLSLEWNYPKCWQSDCRKGPDSDRPNFTKLVQELKKEFEKQQPRLTLAVVLSGYKEVIDKAYEIPEISRAADFISVMTYDYHGAWESKSGHLSPLFGTLDEYTPYYNVNFTMQYIVGLGAEKSKLMVGVPLYGQAYRLSNVTQVELGDPTTGPAIPGEFTKQPGMLAYYEICEKIKRHGWKIGSGPNAHYKDQWVGFDDRESVYAKGKYILQNGFGGATMWSVDLDDFLNRCCVESFPLLKSMNRALGRLEPRGSENTEDCRQPSEPITPSPPILTPHSDAVEGTPRPTTPMTTTTSKRPITWTEKPSTTTEKTTTTTWPTWTWSERPIKQPDAATTKSPHHTWRPDTTHKPIHSTIARKYYKETELSSAVFFFGTSASSGYPTESTTEKKPTIAPVKPGVPCNIGQYSPDPVNCGSYYRCVLGELKREQCAPGLHWDAKRGLCDWPSAAKCQTETSSVTAQKPSWSTTQRTTAFSRPSSIGWTTTRVTTPRTTRYTTSKPIVAVTSTQRPTKHCIHGQYYEYPDSCSNFLVCVNGDLITRQCGPGLNWNKEKNMCDWAFKNPCVEKPKKNAYFVAKDTTSLCVPGSYTSVPGDCQKYQACLWGRHEIFMCAPGLHFNKQTHICDWPSRSNCNDDELVTEPVIAASSSATNSSPTYVKPTTQRIPTTITTTMTQLTSTLPSAEIDPEKVSPLSGHYKVVCYFTNWAWYRKGIGRYLPEHIDHTLCTHIVYGFAVLDYSNLIIKGHDSWADFDNHFYERVVAYKKRGLKVLLALGGWNDSAGDKYSRLVNSPIARKKFIDHALKFIEKYDFDGLDLDWEYPVCWQVDCSKGPDSDKAAFASLLKELSGEFKNRGLLLSAAVSPSKRVIDKGYDVPALAKYLDWIAVMTYDFHGQWDKRTGHVAPLYYHPKDEYDYFNANFSINYWISKGASPRSIVMGIPLYGQSFTINDPKAGTELNAPASAGNSGEFTRAAGFLSYYEICDRIRNRGWVKVQDPKRRMGPYAYKGSQWVSFDDAEMIRQKAEYIRSMRLGGGMVWALDLDDFRGRCGEGPHPLMHTLQQILAASPNEDDKPITTPSYEGDIDIKPSTTMHTSPPLFTSPSTSVDQDNKLEEFKVICYFTNWAWYRQGGGKFIPEDIDTDLCTHVLYGFAVLDGSSLTIKPHDSWADIDNKFYERVAALKSKGIKVLMALGGWNDSAGNKYSRLVNSPTARRKFITHVIQFIEKYNFEGLDLDWEYPVCWQVDCNKGPESDKESFSMLVKELNEEFKPKGLLLSAAVSPSKRVVDAGYDVPILAKYLDWISVMAYDFHGQWDKKTGHVAPLYHLPGDWEPTFNANFSIHYWMEKGAPAKKLVMGAPLYGQSFSLAERSQSGLNAPTYGGGEAGEATRARGFLSYYEICERTLHKGWTVVQDKERRIGPYAYKGDQWVSFDDAKQISLKAELIKKLGLGGGMIWALDLDDFKNICGCETSPLLKTMNRVLRNYPKGPLCPVTNQFTTIDASQAPPHFTTVQKPIHQTTMSSHPSYLPPMSTTTTAEPDIDDTIEIESHPPPSDDGSVGDCNGRLFIPHKSDCSKYFLCNFGSLSEHSCPAGLYWNQNRCDWPENTKCKSNEKTAELIRHPVGRRENGKKKVVCYITSWSSKRPNGGKFWPEDIDLQLCTHIIYGFAVLEPKNLTMRIQDTPEKKYKEFIDRIAAMKLKSNVKFLIGLGGWKDSKTDKYSRLAHSPSQRIQFAQHALQFIEKHGFDGLDLVWEYPVCWQVKCNRGPLSDKDAFTNLVKDLGAVLRSKGFLLSAAVSPDKNVVDVAYDVPSIMKHLDWVNVMTYDYHGYWEGKTGHAAPLYGNSGDDYRLNVNFSINHWIDKGTSPDKLVMGIPAYGQSFGLSKVSKATPGFREEVSCAGQAGEFTRSPGFLAYYEICDNIRNNGWTVSKDREKRAGPYAWKDNQWISYDDVADVTRKAEYIKSLDLGGGMLWSLDLDDYKNRCGCGRRKYEKVHVRVEERSSLKISSKQNHRYRY
ncbi:hypothetical protein KM043_018281 [Ampulex compressa]|nr:hypothetical protein KM043_018281 [Ampulex compressa]